MLSKPDILIKQAAFLVWVLTLLRTALSEMLQAGGLVVQGSLSVQQQFSRKSAKHLRETA